MFSFFVRCSKDEYPDYIYNDLVDIEAHPGDGRIYITWRRDREGHQYPWSVRLYKSEDGESFKWNSTFISWGNDLRQLYWSRLDTNVENGKRYWYYAHEEITPLFWPPEAIHYIAVSETVSIIPEAGLPDSIPPAPDSIWYTYDEQNVTYHWTTPEKTDSLYYIYWSYGDSIQYAHLRGSPSSIGEPKPYENNQASFPYWHETGDTLREYFFIVSLYKGMLSYPSKTCLVEFEIQKRR
ncbi:hypothetical protein KAW48_11195 [candidate division WOR-3 bacterium]|nr:hypothetical protein [candidate division WOR-3 bacterium]